MAALSLGLTMRVDAVNLSRYRYTIEIGADPEAAELDTQKIRAFCRDPDGCLVTIEYETADDFAVKSTHLFLSADTLRWAIDNKSAADNDGVPEVVLEVNPDFLRSCSLTDKEIADLQDSAVGFALFTFGGGASARCVVTFED